MYLFGIVSELDKSDLGSVFLLVFGLSRIIYVILHAEKSLMNPLRDASCRVGSACTVIISDLCQDLCRSII